MEIQRRDEFNELIKKVPFSEDDYWIYFGHGEGWGNKCSTCYYKLKVDRKPNKECINCWKFEIWEENLTNTEEALLYLLEEADKDHTLSGKMMKDKSLIFEEMGSRLGSGISHSFPEEAKPDSYLRGEIDSDRVILIYSQSIDERDMRMEKLLKGLKERGLYKKDGFPYRRGCIEPHETLIGPWEKWFSVDKDYIE